MSELTEQLYVDQQDGFIVSRERHGDRRYLLDVYCGGVVTFIRRLALTDGEIATFLTNPRDLRILVLQIAKWPHRFEGRFIQN